LLALAPALFAQGNAEAPSVRLSSSRAQSRPLPPGARLKLNRPTRLSLSEFEMPRLDRNSLTILRGKRRALPAAWRTTGAWSTTGERVWRLAIESPAADLLRVHFTDFHAGTGTVWIYSATEGGESRAETYSGGGLHGDGEFWSGPVRGPVVIVEFQPGSEKAEGLPFTIPEIMHDWSAEAGVAAAAAQDVSCQQDAMCFNQAPANAAAVADSVAEMLFITPAGDEACTGVLLNSAGSVKPPYLLTAGHCVNTDAVGRTLRLNFHLEYNGQNGPIGFPQPPGCDKRVRDDNYYDGTATVLVTQGFGTGDFSLLLLKKFPDATPGVVLSGWNAVDAPSQGEADFVVHHGLAGNKNVALVSRVADQDAIVEGVPAPASLYYHYAVSTGFIAPGSSGSPLFNPRGQIIGTTSSAKDPSCVFPTQSPPGFSRFSNIYPSIAGYLNLTTALPAKGGEVSITTLYPDTHAGSHLSFHWNAWGVSKVQLRQGSATGATVSPVLDPAGDYTSQAVLFGDRYYLQDATSGDSSGAANTLAIVFTPFPFATCCGIDPALVFLGPGETTGASTITWNNPRADYMRIFSGLSGTVGTDNLPASGSMTVPIHAPAFPNDATYYTVRSYNGSGTGDVNLWATAFQKYGSLSSEPSVLQPSNPFQNGQLKLSWVSFGVQSVQLRVGSVTGQTVSGVLSPNGALTIPAPNPVKDPNGLAGRTTYYLQDASSGDSSGQSKTLATLVVSSDFTSNACYTSIAVDPNPVASPDGRLFGTATVHWQASSGCKTYPPTVLVSPGAQAGSGAFAINIPNLTDSPYSGDHGTVISTPLGWENTLTISNIPAEATLGFNPLGGSEPSTTTFHVIPKQTSLAAGAGAPSTLLYFTPIAPCHLIDTRPNHPVNASFGPPSLAANQTRTFQPGSGGCPEIPSTAKAYSLNVTAAPTAQPGYLGYLTLWPAGQVQPPVSTLNAPRGGSVSNAAIVPAGTGGAINVFSTDNADLMVDVNGYFDDFVGQNAYAFYAIAPCRIADTRGSVGTFAGPSLAAGSTRSFPLTQSPCLPPAAKAFSLNTTVIPAGPLANLTIWPTGTAKPPTTVLTAPFGDVIADAHIALGDGNGSISISPSSKTDLVLDTNGYFAPPGAAGALLFQPLAPCRVIDTRGGAAPLAGPILPANSSRTFDIVAGKCGVPANVKAYSLNVTIVPNGYLGYFTIWPAGQSQPQVSTVNSSDGRFVANAAIVPAGQNGAVSVFTTDDTHLVVDINGYFVAQQ
jgi:hypothetical protein